MENLVIIKTADEVFKLIEYLADKQYVAYDIETTGLAKGSHIIGLSICAEVHTSYYVVTRYWDVALQQLIELDTLGNIEELLFCLQDKNLVMHNGVFDCWHTNLNFNVDLMPSLHTDTMVLAHILDENRSCGLKELGTVLFGDNVRAEQKEMKESVSKNGGMLTKLNYELYKADCDLIAKYGAKDALLTLKLFYTLIPDLYEQGLDQFFYLDESMPLLRGPTYQLNTTGLRVDVCKLEELQRVLEAECASQKDTITKETFNYVKEEYKGTRPSNTFNIKSSNQLSWLLFHKLDNEFNTLTKEGKNLCKALGLPIPYSLKAKRDFVETCRNSKGYTYGEIKWDYKTKKMTKAKKVRDPWCYMACGKDTILKFSDKYKWCDVLLKYSKNLKLLNTYVVGIQERIQYGIIHPSFLQHGTTSGRYSSRNPNFQNLPRDDKRIKEVIVARQENKFVGADYSQLEPRVFASFSNDERLLKCFENGYDFYSVIGMEVFDKYDCSLKKDDKNSFAKKYPELRTISKVVALSATYGTTAFKMAPLIKKNTDEAEEIIRDYFEKFPSVKKLMQDSHKEAKDTGRVYSLFGRVRRMPDAKLISRIYGNASHGELPYEARNMLNLAINHRIQSTAASIMNRAAIACYNNLKLLAKVNPKFSLVRIVLQVHDELILECHHSIATEVAEVLKISMEKTVELPGVKLIADPKIGNNLAELK